MLVDYLILFAVCQAAYVQPDGITLPITSLSYKSLPTNPKEIALSFPNTENIETTSDAKLIESVSSPRMTSKYVYPGNCNQRPIVPISMLPQSQILQAKSPIQIEKCTPVQNLDFNTASTAQVTTLPLINLPSKVENNTLWNKISNNYSPKTFSLLGATQNVINNSNNTVNSKYCVAATANTAPHNTYKINNVNKPAIYIDGNKQKYLRAEVLDFGDNLEEMHLFSERDSKQNQIKEGIPSKISEGIFAPDLSNNSVQQKNIDFPKNLKAPHIEILSNDIPTVINKGIYPLNNIMLSSSSFPTTHPYINTLNAPPVSGKISITPNIASVDKKVDLTVTPSVKIGNNKVNSPSQQTTVSEVQNINDIGVIHPNTEPLSDLQAPVPTLTTYFYIPRELPKVYQLPSVNTNSKTTPLYYPANIFPTSPVCKESNTYNYVKRENIADTTTVPLRSSNYDPANIMAKTSAPIDTINPIPSILKYYATPANVRDIPTISQLPNVYALPKVTYPDAPQRTETYPSNIIYINMADMSSPKSIDKRVPIYNLDTEAKLEPRPIQPVAGTATLPLYTPFDSKNIKSLNYIPAPNVKHYQPEYTNFAITPSLESQYLCPSNSILLPTSSDLCGSSISDSLNNIISSFTTDLLSAFYDVATPEENSLSKLSDSEFITNSLTDTPSYKYSETSITLSMPVFLLSPPQLESPSFLPVPKVLVPFKKSKNKLSSKKKPKPYISTITINLLPTKEETNDIIIML